MNRDSFQTEESCGQLRDSEGPPMAVADSTAVKGVREETDTICGRLLGWSRGEGIWPETNAKWQRRNYGLERMSPKQKVRLSNRQKHAGIRTKLVTGNRIRCFRCFSVFLFLFFENHWGRQSRSGVKCNKAMMGTIMSNHDGNYKSGGQEKV